MTETEVIEAKRLRRAARSVFDTQKDLVKADLGAASLGKRVASRIAEDGRSIAEEAADTASKHKPVVAAGALALTGWFLRKPILAFAASIFASENGGEQTAAAEEVDAPANESAG